MHDGYEDITSRIDEPPTWYDQNGVPRYGEFHPDSCPNIYSRLVVSMRIACQHCGRRFDVEMHSGVLLDRRDGILPKEWHYGDPPAHGCVGDSMNCEDLEVLQVWHKQDWEWQRCEELEGPID